MTRAEAAAKKELWSPIRIIVAGLLLSQVFFTLLVFQSNLDLLSRLELIAAAGYQPVPNMSVMNGLDGFLPAFCGGLFFTLTAGAGVCFASFLLVCLWQVPGRRHRLALLPLLLLWTLGIIQAFRTDHPLILGAFFLLVPPFVAAFTRKGLDGEYARNAGRLLKSGIGHAAVISAVILIWLPNFNAKVFINIRDQLLLNNPAGSVVNDFYYSYTLYPAEAIKTLRQKQLKTSRIQASSQSLSDRLKNTLRRLDYLPVREDAAVDLVLRQSGKSLLLRHQGRTVIETSPGRFLSKPESVLQSFSGKTDRMAFLRQTTMVSLMIAAPLLLYILLHGGCKTLLSFSGRTGKYAGLGSGLICLALAAALAAPLYSFAKNEEKSLKKDQLGTYLASDRLSERLRALKQMAAAEKIPPSMRKPILSLKDSPWPAERYWTAKALGYSDARKAEKVLGAMLSDPHANVVCAAISSLARSHDPAMIPVLREILVTSDHWYVQFYAYKGLKELGWNQPASI